MSTSSHNGEISREVMVELASFTSSVPLYHQGIYSYVLYISAELAVSAGASFAHDQRIKVFRTRDGSQATVDDILNALLAQYRANPIAYRHQYITPCVPVLVYEGISGWMRPTTALVAPWYKSGGILAHVQSHSTCPKIKLAVQIAKAVEHLHDHNVVHGNIYLGNIFVTDQRKATLTDASVNTLARRLHPHLTGSVVESSMYQAPEFLWPGTDAFVHPTKAMDVYALASTIFAIYTEGPPFRGVSSIRTIEQAVAKILLVGHLHLKRPAGSGISDELWSLLQSCWSRTPEARPKIGELVTALEDIELYYQ